MTIIQKLNEAVKNRQTKQLSVICQLWIVKYRNVEPENAVHLPTLDNGVEVQPPLKVYVPGRVGCVDLNRIDCRLNLYLRLGLLSLFV